MGTYLAGRAGGDEGEEQQQDCAESLPGYQAAAGGCSLSSSLLSGFWDGGKPRCELGLSPSEAPMPRAEQGQVQPSQLSPMPAFDRMNSLTTALSR